MSSSVSYRFFFLSVVFMFSLHSSTGLLNKSKEIRSQLRFYKNLNFFWLLHTFLTTGHFFLTTARNLCSSLVKNSTRAYCSNLWLLHIFFRYCTTFYSLIHNILWRGRIFSQHSNDEQSRLLQKVRFDFMQKYQQLSFK